ncbi:hypothetical protein SAMN06265365_1264 [Tistlia consotensis]|uniref:Virulence factor SrfB n=1 Tax=Tistlia consotensis USBA 355 TaxID=560819 RepID=A0A1Y6CHQ4_9PROT|nr:virulence factor SrfB [Tistlia consotensis]SMF66232.1 hypothetical protein SAMN05428998_12686 [Tistlia consotensis USBA 355]SNS02543.1 hypothetical protein SAMN06265365_1264 [Tistlia consotensis]
MLKQLIDFQDVVTLMPNSGIQMLDFGLDLARPAVARLSRSFWPEVRSELDSDGRRIVRLHPLEEREEGLVWISEQAPGGRVVPEDEVAAYRAANALSVFSGEWLPMPFLRRRLSEDGSGEAYDYGPAGWCRGRVATLAEPDGQGNSHRVTLAFDTTLGPAKQKDAPYLAPEPRDSSDPVEFQLACDPLKIGFFVEAEPVRRWLRDAYLRCLSRLRGRGYREDDIEPGEFWGQYLVLLEAIAAGCRPPRIKLLDTVTDPEHAEPIGVDLVIDVGNSRTCGILIERGRGRDQIDLSQVARLELRDLTRPEFVYSEPFETWIEFSPAQFGSPAHARRVSRKNAFWWPSLVRVGPEATWLAAQSDGTEGITGLSSPKRYLWDVAARPQPWSNTRGLTPRGEDPPEIKGPMVAQLTEQGDSVASGLGTVGTSPRYSRSSLYTLMLVELLSHALVQINSPALRSQRTNRNVPRRLDNVIMTLPSATSLAEQKLLRRRAESACQLIWKIMGWAADDPLHRKPTVKMDWDEATCTHLVYLHNEINHKYQGEPAELFGLIGQGRRGDFGGPALRVASIDIGGGTTDLMVIQHEVEGRRIVHPRQMFREGFRLAGDDLVKVVIEDCVLPRFADALRASGLANPAELLTDLFGGDRDVMSQQDRTLRATFVNQVFTPIAVSLLNLYESTDDRRTAAPETRRVSELIRAEHWPQPHVVAYLEGEARRRGATDFSLYDLAIVMDPAEMANVTLSVLGTMLDDLCDVVRFYGCDLLLLSGRPSRLPVVRERLHSQLPLPPHHVIAMHRYQVGPWYPFRASNYRISDPKTTAAVGAMLCLACEGRMEGFYMKSSELRMHSTARYIGMMNQRGEITDDNVLLENIDLETGRGVVGFDLTMEGPTFIGFRQLPIARWRTTPLYYVSYRNPERAARTLQPPIKVRFERQTVDDNEAVLEDFKQVDATDALGTVCTNQIIFRLQTLKTEQGAEAGYWLDSGILRTPHQG